MRYFPFVKDQIHRQLDGSPFLTKVNGAVVPVIVTHESFFLNIAQHVRFTKGLPMFEALDKLREFKRELVEQRDLAALRGYYAIEDDRATRIQDVLAHENVWESFALPGLAEFFDSARAMTDNRPATPAVLTEPEAETSPASTAAAE